MKKYKFLVPILLVALFLLSIYTLINAKNKAEMEYVSVLNKAKSYRDQGILVDANEAYLEAYGKKPSFDLAMEIGSYYKQSEQKRFIREWGETLVSKYPMEPAAYEYLLDQYIKEADYPECFKLADKFKKRGLSSAGFDALLSQIEYQYTLTATFDDVGDFLGGMCPVMKKDLWGYITANGTVSVNPKFVKAGSFFDDLAPVVDEDGSAYYVDPKGNKKLVILNVDNISELGIMAGGILPLCSGNSWGYYNTDGKYLFGDYDMAFTMGNGAAAVVKNDSWSVVGMDGSTILSGFDGIAIDGNGIALRNDRLFALKDYKYTMYNGNGNVIGNGKYEDARPFKDGTYAAVMVDSKWGFVDKDGNFVIDPKYEDARSFSSGFAAVKMNGKWGFIDMNDQFVIENQFEDARDFSSNGSAFVKTEDGWELLRLYKYN